MADGQVLRPVFFTSPKGQVGRQREGLHTEGSAKGQGQGELADQGGLAIAWKTGGKARARLPGPGETGPVGPGDVLNFNPSAGVAWGDSEGRWPGKTAATSRHDQLPPGSGPASCWWWALPPPCLPTHICLLPKSCDVFSASQMHPPLGVGVRLPFVDLRRCWEPLQAV